MVINVLVEEYYFPLSTWEPVSTVDKKIARFKPPPSSSLPSAHITSNTPPLPPIPPPSKTLIV